MADFSRIWVVGAGAIGSVLAAMLELERRVTVTLVGGRAHWQAVRAQGGLHFEPAGEPAGPSGPIALRTAGPEALPVLTGGDLVLLTGKLPRLADTVERLRGRLDSRTGVIALQNGLRVDAWIASLLGRPVDRGLVYFGAYMDQPGRVRFFPGRLRLRSAPATEFLAASLSGRLACELLPDLRAAEWEKLAINCLANPLAALLGARNAEIGRAGLGPLKEAILREVRAVAAAEGVALELTVAGFDRYITGPTGGNTPSMAIDVARGEATEIAHLNGAVVRAGQANGIPTPANAAVVQLIETLSGPRT